MLEEMTNPIKERLSIEIKFTIKLCESRRMNSHSFEFLVQKRDVISPQLLYNVICGNEFKNMCILN